MTSPSVAGLKHRVHLPRPLRSRSLLLLLINAATLLAGCANGMAPSGLRTVGLRVGRETFTLEVADSNSTREIGLMNRRSMDANAGMIFVFADDELREFWMKNTYIPLDIIFVDSSQHVVSIHSMQPLDEVSRTSSDAPARWAIELNQKAAARCGVKVGDHLDIPADAGGKR